MGRADQPVIVAQDADRRRMDRHGRPGRVARTVPKQPTPEAEREIAQHDLARIVPNVEVAARVSVMVHERVRANATEGEAWRDGVLHLDRAEVEYDEGGVERDVRSVRNRNQCSLSYR